MNCAVTRCDSALSDLEKKEQTGIVLGTYQKCFHLLLNDGRLITVFGAGRQTMPMSLYTDASAENPFAAAPLEEGQRAAFSRGYLLIPEANFFCKLGGAKVNLQRSSLPVPRSADLLRDALLRFGKNKGEGRWLQPWCEYILHGAALPVQATLLRRMDTLIKAIDSGGTGMWDGLTRTVGMGCGLTPSADDIICGLAASAWLYWPKAKKELFLDTLSRFCYELGSERTTRISCQQLKLTARGILSDPVYRLAETLSQGQRDAVNSGTVEAVCYGSSSGTELCMGLLAGVHMAARYAESEGNRNGKEELCDQKQVL